MKKLRNVLGWLLGYYLLISIVFYLYLGIRFGFAWPSLSIFYGWWLISNYEETIYTIHIVFWEPIIIATVLLIAYIIYLNRAKISSLFIKFKQNTKSSRIKRLEQELEELKRKSE